MTPARVEALRIYLLKDERLLDATLVSVLAYAGLRPQEARALRWGDIGSRTIRVERAAAGRSIKATKTGKMRTVRLLAPLAADIEKWRTAQGQPSDDAFVFQTPRGSMIADTDYRNWRNRIYEPAARAVGVDGPPYDLRHSFASLLIYEGRPGVDVAAQIGDSTETTLKTYVHLFEEFDPSARVNAVFLRDQLDRPPNETALLLFPLRPPACPASGGSRWTRSQPGASSEDWGQPTDRPDHLLHQTRDGSVGRELRPKGAPIPVRTHDFIDKKVGKAIPYGVYDLAEDTGLQIQVCHFEPQQRVNNVPGQTPRP